MNKFTMPALDNVFRNIRFTVLALLVASTALAQNVTMNGKKVDMSTSPPIPSVTKEEAQQYRERSVHRRAQYEAAEVNERAKVGRETSQFQTMSVIVLAEYAGEYEYYGSNVSAANFVGGTYFFKPIQILKGTLQENKKIEVKVIFKDELPRPANPSALYRKGERYLLFLNPYISQSNLGHPSGHHWYTAPTTEFIIPLGEK